MNNFILEYFQGINDGSIVVGRWIRLLYERILDGIEDGTYRFDQKKANQAIRFIESFCHHSKGKLAPQLLKLSLWQKAMLSVIFGVLNPDDGCRQFREVFVLVARKQGKTLLAAAIMAYMVYADVDYGAEVYCIAPKFDQSDLVYSAFSYNVDHEEALSKLTRRTKVGLKVDVSNTTIQKIAFSEKKSDGFSPYLFVADEMSSWPAARGLRQYGVLTSGMGAREQPIGLSISSSGYEDEGPFDELVKRGTAFLRGDSRETTLLPFLYMIDDVAKWDDINELRKSMPGLGVSVPVRFVMDRINVAYGSLAEKREFITKYCDVKQSSSMAWLPAEAVSGAACERLRLEDFRGCYCVGGIDLSRTTDLTAAVCVIERGGLLYVFAKFFLPGNLMRDAEARDGLPYELYTKRGLLAPSGENCVDPMDCYRWFRDLVQHYHIYPLKVGYDRYSALPLVQQMKADGFHMVDVNQGENLTGTINLLEGALRDGRVRIGDNDLLKVHLLDSAMKINAETGRRKLVKLTRTCHIDGTAALLDAMAMRQFYAQELGDMITNRPKREEELGDGSL